MTRRCLLCLLIASCVFSQTPSQSTRDAYRAAYRAWREADPSIERDAATAGPGTIALRAARLAAAEARFAAERRKFLDGLYASSGETLSWLEDARSVEPPMTPSKATDDYLATADTAVRRSIETLAKDTDRGIQPLQQALDREQKVLADLTTAAEDERKAAETYSELAAATEQLILQGTVQDRILTAGIRQLLEETSSDAAAWSDYYRMLAAASPASPRDAH